MGMGHGIMSIELIGRRGHKLIVTDCANKCLLYAVNGHAYSHYCNFAEHQIFVCHHKIRPDMLAMKAKGSILLRVTTLSNLKKGKKKKKMRIFKIYST